MLPKHKRNGWLLGVLAFGLLSQLNQYVQLLEQVFLFPALLLPLLLPLSFRGTQWIGYLKSQSLWQFWSAHCQHTFTLIHTFILTFEAENQFIVNNTFVYILMLLCYFQIFTCMSKWWHEGFKMRKCGLFNGESWKIVPTVCTYSRIYFIISSL